MTGPPSVATGSQDGEHCCMPDRLSPLDASFLHLESPRAHMHVGFKARFQVDPDRPPITLARVRALVESRIGFVPRLRMRLAFSPGQFGPPVWVDDELFELDHHVMAFAGDDEPLTRKRFDALADGVLSVPLERSRPLWEIHLAPWLDDNTVGIVMKVHHALVDGLSAVALATLLLDVDPAATSPEPEEPAAWHPRRAPSPVRMAFESLADAGMTPARAGVRLARAAATEGPGLARTLRRAALAVGEDVLRSAPPSYLNASIGPRRTLVGHTTPIGDMLEIKAATGVTLNDVALAVVAGALREVAIAHGTMPGPLKAMVPVARRTADEAGEMGNRIAFVAVTLPLQERRPLRRLEEIHAATSAFKSDGRATGSEAILGAIGVLPTAVQARAARLAASARAYNLVVSNVPGPREPVYLLGARALEVHPVVPLSESHALSVGILSLADRLCFGGYVDPEALPEMRELPSALSASILALRGALGRRGRRVA